MHEIQRNKLNFLSVSSVMLDWRGEIKKKNELLSTEQTNWNAICIGCKLMLGPGIVAFITAAAGQLVWEDLQWGNSSQEQRLDNSPAEMTSAPSPHLWLIGWRFHSRAETIHYWVGSCVTKRPGHLAVACGVPTIDTNPVKDQFSPSSLTHVLLRENKKTSQATNDSGVKPHAASALFIHVKTFIGLNNWWTVVKVSQPCLRLQFV